MKRLALTGIAIFALALGAFAQGTIIVDSASANNGVADMTAGSYYSGHYGLQLWELSSPPSGSALTTLLNGINGAPNNAAAYAALTTDGFKMETEFDNKVMAASGPGDAGYIHLGSYTMADVSPKGGSIVLGMAVWNQATTYALLPGGITSHLGVIAFPQATADLTSVPPGIPGDLGSGWNTVGQDLVMTPVVPEPGTLALAGLGVAALLIFRRRK